VDFHTGKLFKKRDEEGVEKRGALFHNS